MKNIEIKLNESEKIYLNKIVNKWERNVREVKRAYILLLCDKWKKTKDIVEFLDICCCTVLNVKNKYLKVWGREAIKEEARPWKPRKYTQQLEIKLMKLIYSNLPYWKKRWTLELLTKKMRELDQYNSINRETIRNILICNWVNLSDLNSNNKIYKYWYF